MIPFMDEDFLLESETAKKLYHGVAEGLPIIDYHCHLNPGEIAGDKRFASLTDVWLKGDHYKWRAMRAMGVEERLVTGPADDYDRFLAWAGTVQAAIGNPLFHWTHLELKRYFGIDDVLTAASAPAIWKRANEALSSPEMGAHGLITKSNVKVICTTDDPADSLEEHKRIKTEGKLACRVYPAWRPDKALNIASPDFTAYMQTLGSTAKREISSYADLLAALEGRMQFFHSLGCRLSDHAFLRLPFRACSQDEAAGIFDSAMRGAPVSPTDEERYKTALMLWLGARYAKLGWAMQMHIGAIRNNNSRMFAKLGPDTGYDAVADADLSVHLGTLLDALERENNLPKTILYTLNPKDNYAIATMAGCFHEAGVAGKVQFGPAWWFVDQKDGMERHMTDLAALGMLAGFVGMQTDSRSFLSYARHEYFRRIFCNLLGRWVENGEYPYDMSLLEPFVRGVCYDNAQKYFGFES